MSTHDPGSVYLDWHTMDQADARLQAELAHDQVRTIDIGEYAEGSPKWLALWKAIEQAQRWPGPRAFVVNV